MRLAFLAFGSLVALVPLWSQNIDEDLWRDAEDQIHDAIAGRDKDFDKKYMLQLSNFPIYATWNLPDSQYSLYILANSVPRWSPKWVWQPGRRFDDAYGVFVDGLDIDAITNPTSDNQIHTLAQDWIRKQDAATKEAERLNDQWEAYRKHHPKANKQTWWEGRSTKLNTLQVEANIAFAHYNSALPANARTVVALMSRYAKALTYPVDVKLPDSANDAQKKDSSSWPVVSQMPFIGSDEQLARIVTDGESLATTPNKWTGWTIERNRHHHAEDHTRFSGSASYLGFINFGASGGEDHITDHKNVFKLEFSAMTLGYLPISPSPGWYSQYLVENFACGPFKTGVRGISFNPNDFWKEDGMLSLLPSALLVAYKPSVRVTLSDEDYAKVASHLGGSLGFSIGPISFGGGGSSVKTTEDSNSATKTIQVVVNSATPMILGVLSTRLNNGKVCDHFPH